jgi:hypothetical protein
MPFQAFGERSALVGSAVSWTNGLSIRVSKRRVSAVQREKSDRRGRGNEVWRMDFSCFVADQLLDGRYVLRDELAG